MKYSDEYFRSVIIWFYKVSENRVSSLLAWAQEKGKATGVVTTDRFEKKIFEH